MSVLPAITALTPPLQLSWRSNQVLTSAVVGDGRLYGITPEGKIVALNAATGALIWESTTTYINTRLVRQGNRLFAYRFQEGFGYLDDHGTTTAETFLVSFGATYGVAYGDPIPDGQMVYYVVNRGLYAAHQSEGLQFGVGLGDLMPFGVTKLGDGQIVTIDGRGVPTRWHVGPDRFEAVWVGETHGIEAGQAERPFLVAGNRLVLGIGPDTVAYDLSSGKIAWRLSNVPARSFAASDSVVYAAFHGAALWALRLSDGAQLWQRQYLADIALQERFKLALAGDHLYFGAPQGSPDKSILLAVRAADGAFAWLSRSVAGPWAGGFPLTDGFQIYTYGTNHSGAYQTLPADPRVTRDMITVSPRPLRGPAAQFGAGAFRIDLPVSARISAAPYREGKGLGSVFVNNVNWGSGTHTAGWTPQGAGGFTDQNQFGYILVDVTESSGMAYTQSLLIPVNTFPDILWHWARSYIEIMAYHKYVNGYPDQTFGPGNLVTRAESSTIIAQTLGLSGPPAGFQTRFTDIATHWARNYIMALEERGIVSGVLEPDGTFTFRPNNNMSRAEEARIVVRAYNIPGAPSGFATKFTDIAGHWAEDDIKALEAAGYVTGIQEPDGSFTYRPQQSLSRAELCTMVVRIRSLTR